MKKLLSFLTIFLLTVPVGAVEIPDSILPYIKKELREAYVEQDTSECQLLKLDENTYCLLRHIKAPECETVCKIYDSKWKLIKTISFDDIQFTQRPDTMSQERYDELLRLIEFPLVEAHLDKSSGENAPVTLILSLNPPMLTKEQRKSVSQILNRKKVIWDGENFKER
jgi:hypothetical protein